MHVFYDGSAAVGLGGRAGFAKWCCVRGSAGIVCGRKGMSIDRVGLLKFDKRLGDDAMDRLRTRERNECAGQFAHETVSASAVD